MLCLLPMAGEIFKAVALLKQLVCYYSSVVSTENSVSETLNEEESCREACSGESGGFFVLYLWWVF